jgi:putative DNA primase/helicase
MPQVVNILTQHLIEWTNESYVNPQLVLDNVQSITRYEDAREIVSRDGISVPGWFVESVDPSSGLRTYNGQYKPDEPRMGDNGKPIKYESISDFPYDVICLSVRQDLWQKAADRSGVPADLDKYPHFWAWVKANPDVELYITEGAKKAGALLSYGYAAVAVQGVWMACKSGTKELTPHLDYLCDGRNVSVVFDADAATNASVMNANKRMDEVLSKKDCFVTFVHWDITLGKGIDDVLVKSGEKALHDAMDTKLDYDHFRKHLQAKYGELASDKSEKRSKKKSPSHGQVATEISERYRDRLAWHTGLQLWYQYAKQSDGLWSEVPEESVTALVKAHLMTTDPSLANGGYVKGVIYLLKSDLMVSEWDERVGLVPLRDGVLDITTRELTEHSPGYRFLWQLPYKWGDRTVGCEPVQAWLLEAMNGKAEMVQLLRAWLNVVVCRRTNLQRFIECIGAGGTGKGTFFRLAKALVGEENVAVTKLRELETNRFETASFVGKALIQVTDSEKFVGEVPTLKALTGQDPIRCERKGVQQLKPFVPNCTVMVAANEAIQTSDYTSGLQRRRLTTLWTYQVESNRRRDLEKEFEPYLPGVLLWVLEMSEADVVARVRDTDKNSSEQNELQLDMLCQVNPVAAHLRECLVYDPDLLNVPSVPVGKKDSDPEFCLYASHCQWCEENGKKPLSLQAYSAIVLDVCVNQFKWKGVKKEKTRNGAYFYGIRFWRDGDADPFLPAMRDNPVTTRDEGVTAETLAGDDCDGCDDLLLVRDSKNASSSENGLKKETVIKESENSVTSVTSVTVNGSSRHGVVTRSSHPSQVITDSLGQVITEGCSVTYVGNVKSYAKTHAGKEYTVVAVKPNTVDVKETRDAFSPHEVLVVRTASN